MKANKQNLVQVSLSPEVREKDEQQINRTWFKSASVLRSERKMKANKQNLVQVSLSPEVREKDESK